MLGQPLAVDDDPIEPRRDLIPGPGPTRSRLEPRPPASLLVSLVTQSNEFVVAFDDQLQLVYGNPAVQTILGHEPASSLGRSLVDFVHPDDMGRAAAALVAESEGRRPSGWTSVRVLHADGHYRNCDVSAAHVHDGQRSLLAVYGRKGDYHHAVDAVLGGLLEGRPSADVVAPVLDVFAWKPNGAHVAIAWSEAGRRRMVTTGLPLPLTGADTEPGRPWRQARRDLVEVMVDVEELDSERRRLAGEAGRASLWITPVPDPAADEPVLVTFAPRVGGPPADFHAYGMHLARTFLGVVFRWRAQVAQLAAAAATDPLTGLTNRRALFERLASEHLAGAVLFCDLDRFKAVNDQHGHHAGDKVLQVVAGRLRRCVSERDVVARLGGDEFVLVIRDTDRAGAVAVAEAVAAAVAEPVDIDGIAVEVGVSIGVAHDPVCLTEGHIVEADTAQLVVKAQHRHDDPPDRGAP